MARQRVDEAARNEGTLESDLDKLAKGAGDIAATATTGVLGDRVKLVRVLWGEEVHQPIQFHTMRVGPFETTIEIRPGDDIPKMARAAWALLDEVAKEQFADKLDGYLSRIKETNAKTKSAGRS